MSAGDTSAQVNDPLVTVSKACRVHEFGGPEVIRLEAQDALRPGNGEVVVRVKAAGVGPWDAWIRAGKSAVPQPLPLTLGSDLAGVVEAVGPNVTSIARGDAVFGVTNPQFTGSYADRAIATAAMIARKPASISNVAAAARQDRLACRRLNNAQPCQAMPDQRLGLALPSRSGTGGEASELPGNRSVSPRLHRFDECALAAEHQPGVIR